MIILYIHVKSYNDVMMSYRARRENASIKTYILYISPRAENYNATLENSLLVCVL